MANDEFDIKKFKANKSLFIEASAGTGKTYTIQLMVAKMIAMGTPLKKILIVTYTEKAAGELKDRIRKKIDEVLKTRKIEEKLEELTNEQLDLFYKAYKDVDNAAIFTIHSFCQKALKENAYDAGKAFDSSKIDDSCVEELIDEWIRDKWSSDEDFISILKNKNKTSSTIKTIKELFIKSINLYKGQGSDGNEIIFLDEFKMSEFKIAENSVSFETLKNFAAANNFEELKQEECVKSALNILEKNESSAFTKSKKTADSKKAADFINEIRSWKKGSSLFNGNVYKEPSVKSNASNEAYNAFLFFKDLKNKLNNIDEFILNIFLTKNIPDLFNAWQQRKAERKQQSFNDMILSVHQAVTAKTLLLSRLRAQYKFAIIDEFQDTNQLQWDIFRTVFLENENNGNHIFVVGDPKQSIYRFQGTDVNVYTKATQEIGKKTILCHNYRSTVGIIKACNELFSGDFFKPNNDGTQISETSADNSPKLIEFTPSNPPDKEKAEPEINGIQTKGFWLSEKNMEPETYAASVVAQIVEWCSFENEKTRLQIFDKDFGKPGHENKLRNVTFKDFAILAKSRSEMEIIEKQMRLAGIPYTRYKEANLFRSRECAEWISLFHAINAPDFSSWNRRILNEVLITDFFREKTLSTELQNCESDELDNPNHPKRMQIASWRKLALNFRYAEMLEKIYQDTEIEKRLMSIEKLQCIARLRQIGNYAIDYLYNHKCSLEDLIRHLEGLARYEENTDDENGDLVEKSTDFNAVQVITIHSSKGLEFPIVISVAGFKKPKSSNKPYIYHQEDSIHLGFSEEAKKIAEKEEMEEWKRLFYVAFTRASSIMVIPQYCNWYKTSGEKSSSFKHLYFLIDSLNNFKGVHETLSENSSWLNNPKKIKQLVQKILLQQNSEISLSDEKIVEEENKLKERMETLQKELKSKSILQHSYSSLAGITDSTITEADHSRTEKEGVSNSPNVWITTSKKQNKLDENVIFNQKEEDSSEEVFHISPEEENYPRGAKVGNALHSILEQTSFKKFGTSFKTLNEALHKNEGEYLNEIKNLIEKEFNAVALPISKNQSWMGITIRYLWNTLNAKLPSIAGNQFIDEESFRLIDLPDSDCKSEIQFGLNAEDKETSQFLHYICKGFIDLLFVRKDNNGNLRYSILDWKSDVLENYKSCTLKEKVDEDYSIQRVLYSYCLIQWLKQFYGKETPCSAGLNEQEVFEKHFGGIYYAFLRGTDGNTESGIYAQTWKDYATLEKAYQELKALMEKEGEI